MDSGFFKDHRGAVLVDHEIEELAKEAEMIAPFDKAFLRGASYDLRLGEEYSTAGAHRMLSSGQVSCRLEPGQFILLTSHEHLTLPKGVVGHAGLISKWAQSGLISLFSPQIDPGFKGLIVVPLFNGGNAPIGLRLYEPMFTVEFVRTTEPVARGWAEDNPPLVRIPSGVDVQMGRPNFSAIDRQIGELHEHLSMLEARFDGFTDGTTKRYELASLKANWLAIVIAVVALAVAIVVAVKPFG
jgi:deoxycytidine triphosphate deaminase